MEDLKEKLVELLESRRLEASEVIGSMNKGFGAWYADHLIAHGVTVQELDGCKYCEDSESVYHHSSGMHDSMDEDVYISGNSIVVDVGCHSYGTAVIKFCPMCGRRLPKPTEGE